MSQKRLKADPKIEELDKVLNVINFDELRDIAADRCNLFLYKIAVEWIQCCHVTDPGDYVIMKQNSLVTSNFKGQAGYSHKILENDLYQIIFVKTETQIYIEG